MRILMSFIALVIVATVGASLYFFKQGLDDYLYTSGFASVPIAPPAGWVAEPFELRHAESLTGATYDPEPEVQSTTNRILARYDAAAGKGNDSAAFLFTKGEERIALRMAVMPVEKKRVSLRERLGYEAEVRTVTIDPADVLGTMDGVQFVFGPRSSKTDGEAGRTPVNYRYLSGRLGDPEMQETVELTFLTNSSDAALAELLAGIDMAEVVARIETEPANYVPGSGFQTAQEQPFSDTPPAPTNAYQAMMLLQSDPDLDALSHEVAVKLRNAEITTFEELVAAYPNMEDIDYSVLQLVKSDSATASARYYAVALANSGRAWSPQEYYVLSQVARAGTGQADLADYMADNPDIAPEVVALVNRLPETGTGDTPEAAQGSPVKVNSGGGSSTFRSSGCKIVGGVRRCTVGSN